MMDKKDRSIIKVLAVIFNKIFETKKWWLLPVWILLSSIGLFLLASGSAFLIPAIYMGF